MPSDIEKLMVRRERLRARSLFDYAVLIMEQQFVAADDDPDSGDSVPLYTGFLRENWRKSNRSVTSDILRTTISVSARDNGVDYAAILENAKRIEPRKAKYLRFRIGPDWVTSYGFDNKWYQWWTEWLGKDTAGESSRWTAALAKASARNF